MKQEGFPPTENVINRKGTYKQFTKGISSSKERNKKKVINKHCLPLPAIILIPPRLIE
jgi:hypothetical protein